MKYTIKIPHQDIDIHEVTKPQSCPIAAHFTKQGYKVSVSGFRVHFWPLEGHKTGPSARIGLHMGDLVECQEKGQDFEREVDLPDEIATAEPGSMYRRA